MADTQEKGKFSRWEKKETSEYRLEKRLCRVFGVERIDHVLIVIGGAVLVGFLVEYYILK